MLTRSNVEIVCHFYERFARGELASLVDFFADRFVFHPAGQACQLAGVRRGRHELLKFAVEQSKLTNGTWVPRPYAVLGSESHVAVLVTVDAQRGERSASFKLVHVWRIEQGRAVELRSYVDDQYAYDRFFYPETRDSDVQAHHN
jgi:ketosteroid isomerase-like protein